MLKKEPPQESYVREGVFVFTAILTVLGALARDYAQVPWWYRYLTGAFVLASLIVLIRSFLWPWLGKVVEARSRRHTLNKVAKELFLGFQDIVRSFQDLANPRSSETLPTYLTDLLTRQPHLKTKLPNLVPLACLTDFFPMFLYRFEKWNGTYDEFKILAREFFTFVYQYNRLYVREPLSVLRGIPQGELPDDIRRKLNLLRENYVAFLRQYVAFAKMANSRYHLDQRDYRRLATRPPSMPCADQPPPDLSASQLRAVAPK